MICADVLDWARDYRGEPFHALLCDPPYHLGRDGFMNKSWDAAKYGIAFNPDTWAALAEHLHPGAFGMAFASARGWHRLAVAIEDAGLRIHPTIFGYCYGSGFPKSTKINRNGNGRTEWAGHRYGLQALKPALEPIIVFQKPYTGKPVDCITETGAGALWIDGGRVGPADDTLGRANTNNNGWKNSSGGDSDALLRKKAGLPPQGRWPANFTLTHHPDCVRVGEKRVGSGKRKEGIARPRFKSWRKMEGLDLEKSPELRGKASAPDNYGTETVAAWECVESCPVRRLGEQSGESTARPHRNKAARSSGWKNSSKGEAYSTHSDTGTAARFFHQSDWSYEIAERLAQADPVRYQAKAGRKERTCDGTVDTQHPTVKPIALTRWLATLLLPPPAYAPRRLLVPFAGVASEMIGAYQAGWEEVVGVELDAEYCDIGQARLDYHGEQMKQKRLL